MADVSRFPEGILITGDIAATARPVGSIILDVITSELFRSTNAAVATYTQISDPAGTITDGQSLTYGTGLDVVHTADAATSNEQISQGAGAGDVQYMDTISVLWGTGEDVDFSPDGTNLLVSQGAGAGSLVFLDGMPVSWGTGIDVTFTPDAASGNLQVSTGAGGGDMQWMDNAEQIWGTGEDVIFQGNGTDLLISQGAGTGAFRFQDTIPVSWGTGNDVIWTPNGTNVDQTGGGEVRGNGAQNVVADPGTGAAIPVTLSGSVAIVTAGAETNTLAAPTYVGQTLVLYTDTYVGDRVVTVAAAFNVANNTILTFGAATEACQLIGVELGGVLIWQLTWNDGVGLS